MEHPVWKHGFLEQSQSPHYKNKIDRLAFKGRYSAKTTTKPIIDQTKTVQHCTRQSFERIKQPNTPDRWAVSNKTYFGRVMQNKRNGTRLWHFCIQRVCSISKYNLHILTRRRICKNKN